MLTSSFSGDIINVALRQLGASSIKEIRNGILYIAKFELSNDLCVTYVFNVTKRDKYYLQRVSPYPISHGDFDGPDQVVDFIRKDIRKFRNAHNSHNFPKFLETTDAMVRLSHAVELLFLERNISAEDLDSLAAVWTQRSTRSRRSASIRPRSTNNDSIKQPAALHSILDAAPPVCCWCRPGGMYSVCGLLGKLKMFPPENGTDLFKMLFYINVLFIL